MVGTFENIFENVGTLDISLFDKTVITTHTASASLLVYAENILDGVQEWAGCGPLDNHELLACFQQSN